MPKGPALTLRAKSKKDRGVKFALFKFWSSRYQEGAYYGGPATPYQGRAVISHIVMTDGTVITAPKDGDWGDAWSFDLLPPYDEKEIAARRLKQKDDLTMARMTCPDCRNAFALCICHEKMDDGEWHDFDHAMSALMALRFLFGP